MSKMKGGTSAVLAGVSLAVLAGAAQAQAPQAEQKAQAAAPKSQAPVLQEVVVTADRKGFGAELVQAGSFGGARQLDTPLTISVISQQVILSQQALSIYDALKNSAGVTSSQTSPTVYNNLSIRGIAVDNRGNYRLDGSLPIVNLIDLPLEDKDRVEALKGASAMYYGFTTPSGIINLTMKRPTANPYLATTLFGDDNGSVGGHVDASNTWGIFGARVNAVYAGVDSGIDDTYGHRSLISGAFDLKPTQALTARLDVEHIEKTVPEPTVFLLTAPKSTLASLYPHITLPPLLDPSTNLGGKWMRNEAEETNVLGHVDYKINTSWDVTLEAGTSIENRSRRFSTFTPTNLSTGQGTLAVTLQNDAIYVNKNYRGEVAGTFYTGPVLHELMFGATQNVRTQFSPATAKGLCSGATCQQNMFDPVAIPESALPSHEPGVMTSIDDIGYYAFDRAKLGEWLQVLAGVRKSDYTEANQTTGQTTFHAEPLSGSYGVVVKPRSWASLYGTYIEGLESTPSTPIAALNYGQQLPPTHSRQYEGGFKLEPKRGFLIQGAYFDINRASTYINSADIYVEDGRAEYRGFELSATGEVTRDLSIYVSGLALDAEQVSGAPTVVSGKTVTPTAVGKLIDNTPRTSGSVAGEYKLSRYIHGLSVNGGVYYVGKRAINPLNEAFAPGYTLVNLGAAYETRLAGHDTTFRLNAENVGAVRYWVSTSGLYLAEGAPQVIKVSVSSRF